MTSFRYWNYSNATTTASTWSTNSYTDSTASNLTSAFLESTTASSAHNSYYQPYSFYGYTSYDSETVDYVKSEEKRQEVLRALEERKEKAEKLRIEKEAARQKARELLLEYLDEQNKERFAKNEPLIIKSNLLNDISYHIPISHSKIKAIKNFSKEVVSELCVTVLDADIPLEDMLLSKVLYAMNDEKSLLKIAKHWNVKQNLLEELN